MPLIPEVRGGKNNDQKFKVILGHRRSSRLAWVTQDLVWKRKNFQTFQSIYTFMNSLYFAFCVIFCLHILVPTDQGNLQK